MIISNQNLSFPRMAIIDNHKIITYECSEKLGLSYQNAYISDNNITLEVPIFTSITLPTKYC